MEKQSILVVDDEKTIREALCRVLHSKGYEVAIAESGEKALEQLNECAFDLIISDLVMPGIGGVEVIRAAKGKYPDICSFILTGYGDMATAIEALNIGVDEFILKPFGKDELLRRIEFCLEKRNLAIKVQRYELMLSASTDMVALFDQEQRLIEANEAFMETFRVTRPFANSLSMKNLFGGEKNDAVLNKLLADMHEGKLVHSQEWFLFEEEGSRLLDVTIKAFKSQKREEYSLLTSLRDVTDLYLISQDPGKNQNSLQLALDATMDAVWDYDVSSDRIRFGENWYRLLGYRKDELADKLEKWCELLHPGDVDRFMMALQEHLEGKRENFWEEFRMRTSRGLWRWVLMRGKVVERDADGSPLRFIGTHKNIDARKYSEELLYASEEKYRSLFNSPNIGIFRLILPSLALQEANVAARKILGIQDKPAGNEGEFLLGNIIENSKKTELLQAIRAQHEIRFFQAEMKRRDGSTFWAEINLQIKEVKQYVEGTITDITTQKKAEALLLSNQHELEKMVALRTAELQEALQHMSREMEERQQIEETLRKSEAALIREKKQQEEVNTALNVLLRKREQDKKEIGENVLFNVKELIDPIIEKLEGSTHNDRQKALLELLQENLKELTAPFVQNSTIKFFKFTPTELQVANMVRHGKTTKEIAKLMNISSETVSNHRKNIRKKSGLTRSKRNLRSTLTLLKDVSD